MLPSNQHEIKEVRRKKEYIYGNTEQKLFSLWITISIFMWLQITKYRGREKIDCLDFLSFVLNAKNKYKNKKSAEDRLDYLQRYRK